MNTPLKVLNSSADILSEITHSKNDQHNEKASPSFSDVLNTERANDQDSGVDQSSTGTGNLEFEEGLMDTSVVTESQKKPAVNVFVPNASANSETASFGDILKKQASQLSSDKTQSKENEVSSTVDVKKTKNKKDIAAQSSSVPAKATSSSTVDKDKSADATSSVEDNTSTDIKIADDKNTENNAIDHAIAFAQLMQPTQLDAETVQNSKLLSDRGINAVSIDDIQGQLLTNGKKIDANALTNADNGTLSLTDISDATAESALMNANLLSKDALKASSDVALSGDEKNGIIKLDPAMVKETSTAEMALTKNSQSKQSGELKSDITDVSSLKDSLSKDKTNLQNQSNSSKDSSQQFGAAQQLNDKVAQTATLQNQSESTQFSDTLKNVQSSSIQSVNSGSMQNTGLTAGVQQTAGANNIAAQQAIPVPVGYANWDQALGQRVGFMISNAQHTATLSLNPPELGPLQVVVQMKNGTHADATFITNQPEVKQAIETALPKLREMLDQSGIQLGQTNINSNTQQQKSQQNQYAQNPSGNALMGSAMQEEDVSTPSAPKVIDYTRGIVNTFA